MATASATITVPAIVGPTRSSSSSSSSSSQGKNRVVKHVNGLNSYGGLKAQNKVGSLGLPVCSEQSFAKIVSSLKKPSKGRRGGGGALTSTCSAVEEIFRIAAIMPGLVLVGVAVGFVLLRVEAFVEEEQ